MKAGNPGIRGTGMRCGNAQMAVVESASGADLVGFIKRVCAPGATVVSDGWSGYASAATAGFDHLRLVEGRPENASELFPRRMVKGAWRSWAVRDGEMEQRRAA